MKIILGSVFLVGLIGFVLGGIYNSDTGYVVVDPGSTHQVHHAHYQPISAADESGGYSSVSSGGYSSSGESDSFADPKNRSPDTTGPKPVYGVPAAPVTSSKSVSSVSSASSASLADDDAAPDIDLTPVSFTTRAWTFIRKQFSAILGFLRRIWGRLRGTTSSS